MWQDDLNQKLAAIFDHISCDRHFFVQTGCIHSGRGQIFVRQSRQIFDEALQWREPLLHSVKILYAF